MCVWQRMKWIQSDPLLYRYKGLQMFILLVLQLFWRLNFSKLNSLGRKETTRKEGTSVRCREGTLSCESGSDEMDGHGGGGLPHSPLDSWEAVDLHGGIRQGGLQGALRPRSWNQETGSEQPVTQCRACWEVGAQLSNGTMLMPSRRKDGEKGMLNLLSLNQEKTECTHMKGLTSWFFSHSRNGG
jgi:hypothetical protein